MQKQFVAIQIPLELKNNLVIKKGHRTYQEYIEGLMNKNREGHSMQPRPSKIPNEESLTNG